MDYIKISPNTFGKSALISYGDICVELSPDFLKDVINLTDSHISEFDPQQRTIFRKFTKGISKILEAMGELTLNKPSYESIFEHTQKLFIFEYSLVVDYSINLSKEQSIKIKLLHHLLELGIDQDEALNKITKLLELEGKKLLSRLFTITNPQTLEIVELDESDPNNVARFEELVEKLQGIYGFMNQSFIKESIPNKDSLTFISQQKFIDNDPELKPEQKPSCSCNGSCSC
jgi:hypothetical protein